MLDLFYRVLDGLGVRGLADDVLMLARPVIHPERIALPTLLVLVVAVPVAASVARRHGGRPWAAMAGVVSLVLVLDATALRPGLLSAQPNWLAVPAACRLTDADQWGVESVLNIGLFTPLAFFAVLAVGRRVQPAVAALGVTAACGALSLGVEVLQAAYSIGRCDSSDVVHNVMGAAIGAGCAALIALALPHQPTPTATTPARPATPTLPR